MFSTLIGCALNVVLDPVAIFVLGWGMKGADFLFYCLKETLAADVREGRIMDEEKT